MSSGFTLIELLVVISIIAVLSVMGLVSYQNATRTARDGRRKGDLSQTRAALELYRTQFNNYPPTSTFSTLASTLKTAQYLSDPLPADPKGPTYTQYNFTSTGVTYCMCALLEANGSGNSSNNGCNGNAGNYYCVTQP